jgi:hypothetical protein
MQIHHSRPQLMSQSFKPSASQPFAKSIPARAQSNDIQFGALGSPKKGGLFSTIAAWTSAIGMLGGYGFFAMTESNPPGVHSVVYDATNNGHQEKVHGPGLVWLGPLGMAPFINPVHNAPLSTSDQFVVENIQPATQEQRTIPNLQIGIDFSINPEYLRTVMVDTLGGIHGDVQVPTGTAFANIKDPNIKKVYIQLIRPTLIGMINDLSTTYRGENYHKITDFLTVALNNGFEKYPIQKVTDQGHLQTTEVKNIQSLQQKVGSLVTINKVYVTEVKLPEDIAGKLEEQAKQPLERLIAGLSKDLEDVRTVRNKAEGEVAAAQAQETASQEAAVLKLGETGKIQIQTASQEKKKVDAEAEAAYNKIKATTDKTTNQTLAVAQEKAAKIKAEANKQAALIEAEAEAKVKNATQEANAELAKLKGEPYQQYPELNQVDSLDGSSKAIQALTAKITYLDPKTGLKIDMLNIGNGQTNGQGIVNQIIGQKAANKLTPPEQPATQPQK